MANNQENKPQNSCPYSAGETVKDGITWVGDTLSKADCLNHLAGVEIDMQMDSTQAYSGSVSFPLSEGSTLEIKGGVLTSRNFLSEPWREKE